MLKPNVMMNMVGVYTTEIDGKIDTVNRGILVHRIFRFTVRTVRF